MKSRQMERPPARPRMQVVRGLPGSGKSTLARRRWPGVLLLKADQFFTRGGVYKWTPGRDAKSRKWLLGLVRRVADCGMDVVVAGVFPSSGGLVSPVVREALARGYDVWIETLPSRGRGKDVHGVRRRDFDAMERALEPGGDVVRSFETAAREDGEGPLVYEGSMPGVVVEAAT